MKCTLELLLSPNSIIAAGLKLSVIRIIFAPFIFKFLIIMNALQLLINCDLISLRNKYK